MQQGSSRRLAETPEWHMKGFEGAFNDSPSVQVTRLQMGPIICTCFTERCAVRAVAWHESGMWYTTPNTWTTVCTTADSCEHAASTSM